MTRITISGIGIEYDLLGKEGAPAIALTPGGRFPLDTPGLRNLAEKLAAGGRRVLIWDRPNCGSSDLNFDADTESELHAQTLLGLIRELDLGKTALAAGSAGSRVSLIAASRDPDLISHLFIWWISGGPIGLMQLAIVYCSESASLVLRGGMEAVVGATAWAEQIERNPSGRDILLAQDPERFYETMQRWAKAYSPSDDSPVPGMKPGDFAKLTMPVMILRSGNSDMNHTRATSEWVHKLIPHSQIVDPPWPDEEWNNRVDDYKNKDAEGLFVNWPVLAPAILDFTNSRV
jgi:pimeloyl-ACP methyl ester carboxylesterase